MYNEIATTEKLAHSDMIILNANGWISKKDMIELFVEEIKPIFIMESHVTDIDEEALISFREYNIIICYSNSSHTRIIIIYVRVFSIWSNIKRSKTARLVDIGY